MPTALALDLLMALAIGLVVGVERGWRERDQPDGSRTAGVRTYALIGLLGGVAAVVARSLDANALLAIAFAAFLVVFGAFSLHEAVRDARFSITGVVSAALVFLLGALAVVGDTGTAAAGGVAVAGVLAARDVLHGFLARLTWLELRSALLLLAMTVIVLPLLPATAIDPYGALVPREIWVMTVLVAAFSFAGYAAMRILGSDRGVAIAGAVGGMVSSTAVTIAFARRAAIGEAVPPLVAGSLLAGAISVGRAGVIAALVAPALAPLLAPPVIAAALVFVVGAWLRLRGGGARDGAIALGNPIELMPVLGFAVLLALVALVSSITVTEFGTGALFAVSALSALADIDAIVLSTSRLAAAGLPVDDAVAAILIAAATNAAMRFAYGAIVGSRAFAVSHGAVTLAAIAAGALAFVAAA
jgi:uncharacterized membrane protein (DUF4010 family)